MFSPTRESIKNIFVVFLNIYIYIVSEFESFSKSHLVQDMSVINIHAAKAETPEIWEVDIFLHLKKIGTCHGIVILHA